MKGAFRATLLLTVFGFLMMPGAFALEAGVEDTSTTQNADAGAQVATPTTTESVTVDDADRMEVQADASVTTADIDDSPAVDDGQQVVEDGRGRVADRTFRVLQPVPYGEEAIAVHEAVEVWADEKVEEQEVPVDAPEETATVGVAADGEADEGVTVEAQAQAAGQQQSASASDAEARSAAKSASVPSSAGGWGYSGPDEASTAGPTATGPSEPTKRAHYSMYTGPGPSWIASAGAIPLSAEEVAAVVATTFFLGGTFATAGFILIPGWRAVAVRLLKATPLAFLFSRIDKDEVLENERRSELFEFIRQNPGERLEVVRRRMGLANGTMLHHVKVLCDKDLVRRVKQGGITRLYPAGPKICPKPYLIPQRRMVLQAVMESPGLAQRSIGRKLGMSERMVSYHVRQLASDGLLDVQRDGGRNRCYPGLPVEEIPQLARAEALCPLPVRS